MKLQYMLTFVISNFNETWNAKWNVKWYIHIIHINTHTVYAKKYAHGFCFAVLCCGYTLTDFPISIRLSSLALWQSNDCPSASKATLMNMDKYFMWIHYERLHNPNKAKHNKTVCIFLRIYCTCFQYGNGTGDWPENIRKINDQCKSSQQEEISVILPKPVVYLTHRDLVTHMWVNWVIIDSGNGLSIIRRQAISWANEEFFNKTH